MPAVVNDKNALDLLPLFTKGDFRSRVRTGMSQKDYKEYPASKLPPELL